MFNEMGLLQVALFMHRIGAAVDIPFTSNYGAQQNSSFGRTEAIIDRLSKVSSVVVGFK